MNSEIDDREDLRVEELLSYKIMGAPAEFAFDARSSQLNPMEAHIPVLDCATTPYGILLCCW